jgi:hypothetical protein
MVTVTIFLNFAVMPLLRKDGYPVLAPTATGGKPMSLWMIGREPSRATRCM